MSQTIDDFRNLLRDDKHTHTFYVNKALNEVLLLLKNNLKEIDIQHNILQDIALVGYKNELIQVFIILFSNAIEALDVQKIDDKIISINMEDDSTHISISI